jgi:hypothetical protein
MAKQLIHQFDINGQTRTFNFGMYCWEIFCEKMDVAPGDMLTVFQGGKTFKAIRFVVYCGIVANDFLNGVPDSVTEREVAAWLNNEPDGMGLIFNAAMLTFYDTEAEKMEDAAEPKAADPSKKKP